MGPEDPREWRRGVEVGGGGGGERWGEGEGSEGRGEITLHCPHQADCAKTGRQEAVSPADGGQALLGIV